MVYGPFVLSHLSLDRIQICFSKAFLNYNSDRVRKPMCLSVEGLILETPRLSNRELLATGETNVLNNKDNTAAVIPYAYQA